MTDKQVTLLAGCIAAAGAIHATDEGIPRSITVWRYAKKLYAEVEDDLRGRENAKHD